MFILDRLLFGSLEFVLDKVATAVDAELQDDTVPREQLLEAQMKLELGEISEAEFAEIERDVLARLREIAGKPTGLTLISDDVRVTGVEATVADELNDTRR
jgi:hypothetical protein